MLSDAISDAINLPNQYGNPANPFDLAARLGAGVNPLWFMSNSNAGTSTPQGTGAANWLKANATAVYVVAGALFVLALFAGGRR